MLIVLLLVQLVPVWLSLGVHAPLPLRHAASELSEVRLWTNPGGYVTTLLPLPGWLFVVIAGALDRVLATVVVHRVLLSIALLGGPLAAMGFASRLGRPRAVGLLGGVLASGGVLFGYGLSAHLLSLIPFWWGARELVNILDHRERPVAGRLAIALLLCAALSAASFVVLAIAVLFALRRGRARVLVLEVLPSVTLAIAGLLVAADHPELVALGDPWTCRWAGVWPILRELPTTLWDGLPSVFPQIGLALFAATCVLGALFTRHAPSARHDARHDAAHQDHGAFVVRTLLGAAVFLSFYLPRATIEPVASEAIGERFVGLLLPLVLLVAVRRLDGWRVALLLPAVTVAIAAPLLWRQQLSKQRPIAPWLLLVRGVERGARVCAFGNDTRRVEREQSPISTEGRSESAALWSFVARGGTLPSVRRFGSALAVAPGTAPPLADYATMTFRGLQDGAECDDYIVFQPPPILGRDPTVRRGDELFGWVRFHRIHPRPETP